MQVVNQVTIALIELLKSILLSLLISTNLIPYPNTVTSAISPDSNSTPSGFFRYLLPKPTPTPTPSPPPQSTNIPKPPVAPTQPTLPPQPSTSSGLNYQLEPDPSGQEGFYIMKAAPSETMSTVNELNAAVNQYRLSQNLNPLFIDPQLCPVAHQRAVEASTNFSHSGFNDHFNAGDYDYIGFKAIAENLWQGQFSGVHIVEFGWDQSPGHRANLQGDFSRGCAGISGITAAYIFVK